MSIKYPEVKRIKKGKKTIEELEETNCHICNLITYYICNICGRYACSKHTKGYWRKIGRKEGKKIDICDKCLEKGL